MQRSRFLVCWPRMTVLGLRDQGLGFRVRVIWGFMGLLLGYGFSRNT